MTETCFCRCGVINLCTRFFDSDNIGAAVVCVGDEFVLAVVIAPAGMRQTIKVSARIMLSNLFIFLTLPFFISDKNILFIMILYYFQKVNIPAIFLQILDINIAYVVFVGFETKNHINPQIKCEFAKEMCEFVLT